MVTEEDGGYYCDGCDAFFNNSNQAEKHEFDCPELAGYYRRIISWFSRRFISKHGFDRRKSSTKMLEYLYFRYLMDGMAVLISATIIVVRLLLIFEIEQIPSQVRYRMSMRLF